MHKKLLRNSFLAVAAFTLVACGGPSDTADAPNDVADGGPGTGTGTCDPKASIGCFKGEAEPCKNFHTGFDGDDYCLQPPDPSVGYQIHVGPKDYTDVDETSKYMIAPGGETNWDEVQQLNLPSDVYGTKYYSHMRPGSHHFILFALPPDSSTQVTNGPSTNGGSGTESAVGATDGEFVAGATRLVQNAALNSDFPEDQGIGRLVKKNAKYAVNLHFINTSDHPLLQEIWVNFIEIPGDQVTHWVRAITWYGGLNMAIPPRTNQVLKSPANSCVAGADMRMLGLTAHFHANTVREIAEWTPADGSGDKTLFEEYNWHEPTEWLYSRAATNPQPNETDKVSGGMTGLVNVKKGDVFNWECDVQNTTDSTLTFSNHVYTGEMCNVFGLYTTDNPAGSPWTCAFF